MFSPKTKRNLYKIIPFSVISVLSGWVFLIVELAATGGISQLPETAIKMDFQIFILSSLAMAVVGLLTGYIEFKYLYNIFSDKKFTIRVFSKLMIYSIFFLIIVLIFFPTAASLELNTHIFDRIIWEKYLNYFTSITHLST
ncbi:MAG: adenylate/guanylate cyclase domain-containing protein, partial [Saprospiraceae bacterium]